MKRLAALLLLLLAGCVPAQPFASPMTFSSPAPTPAQRLFVPSVSTPEHKLGVGVDRAYMACADLGRVGATWFYDWSPQPQPCVGVDAIPMLYAPGDGVSNPPPADVEVPAPPERV